MKASHLSKSIRLALFGLPGVLAWEGSQAAITLTAAPNPATYGQTVHLQATAPFTFPSGTMDFKDGSSVLCSNGWNSFSGASYVFDCYYAFNAGTHSVIATYSGDGFNSAQSSNTVSEVVQPYMLTIALGSNPNPSTAFQNVKFSAQTSTPTGTMTFREGSNILCSSMVNPGGFGSYVFDCNVGYLTAGAHAVIASYSGDPNYTGTSNTANQVVQAASTTTNLTSSVNPSAPGQSVTFHARINNNPYYGGGATVTFSDGGNVLCNAVQATAATSYVFDCSVASLNAGTHPITATFSGDAYYSGSTSTALSQAVLGTRTLDLNSTPNPSLIDQAVTFVATVNGNSPTGTVTFSEDNTVLCNAVGLSGGGTASCVKNFTTVGSHTITAGYSGDSSSRPAAVSHIQTVNATASGTERAALDALYRQANGVNWKQNAGWGGAAGTECTWYGISCSSSGRITVISLASNNLAGPLPSLAGLSELQRLDVQGNQLTGSIPDLSSLGNLSSLLLGNNQFTGVIPPLGRLVNLSTFDATNNQLTGSIPSLTGLNNLQSFSADNNRLSDVLPDLSVLPNLRSFTVSRNRLSGSLLGAAPTSATPTAGSLPSLDTLDVSANSLTGILPALPASLRSVRLGDNAFVGDLPTPPQNLSPGASSVCDNTLTRTANPAWDAATGQTPWYTNCTALPSALSLTITDTTVATGTNSLITATVTTTGKALLADTTALGGSVIVTDDKAARICYIKIVDGTGSCPVILPPSTATTLLGAYSGTTKVAPASTKLGKTTPPAVPGNLDQHGWTGSWYNPATSGQGIVFEIYPDLIGTGTGLLGGGWFTYDTTAGGEEAKRWYSLSGPVSSASPRAALDILATTNGNFNAGPVINSSNGKNYVGHATIDFSDCSNGSLSYEFTDGSNRVGNMPLRRIGANITCDPTNGKGNGTVPGNFLLSGAWYTPSTSGQGLLFELNPTQNVTFATWYTFAPNGQGIGGSASQRWYTLQAGSINVSPAPLTDIGIYSAQGGLFDAVGSVSTPRVGTASVVFKSCNALTLTYSFTSGSNNGLSGTIDLQRAGPTPAGCSL